MSFGNAAVLAVLPVALALAFLAVRRLRAQHRDPATQHIAKRWADHRGLGDTPPVLRDAARGVLLVAGVAFAVVALARPQWGEIEQQSFDPAREVLLALDLSRSMTADDVAPTRLDRAKLLVETLLDSLQGERVGLVVFAGTSFLQSPLSADYEVMRDLLTGLDPDYLPQGGTRYDLMLRASLDAFGQETEADRFLVVLSDGEAHNDAWRARLPALRKKGIRVIALGIGTAAGSILSDETGAVLKDERGAAVLSRLEADTLNALADETEGLYRDAAGWVDIAAVVDETVSRGRKGEFVEERQVLRQERFQWVLGPALLLLLLSAWLELPVVPSARLLRRTRARSQPRPVFFETPVASPSPDSPRSLGSPVWIAAILVGVAGAPSAEAASGAPGAAPTEPPVNPLVTTIGGLLERPAILAGDYAWLAEQTLDVAKEPASLPPDVRDGVIDDALAAVVAGEALDAEAADWTELKRLLEALPRQTPPPQTSDSKDGEASESETGAGDDTSESSQGGSEDEPRESSSDSSSESEDASASDAGESDEAQEAQNREGSGSDTEDAGRETPPDLPEVDDAPETGFGELADAPEPQPREPAEPTPTRLVGGGSATPDTGDHPELADALGKLQNVRDADSPAVLFERMNEGQKRPRDKGNRW
ncbi:MAG: VWA domain-containing protein [Myxococcales bacterium]|nr:VWA domain-containing protein [Myxococcales bacterium]